MNENTNSNQAAQSQATSSKGEKFLTNGGRALNAVWSSQKLKSNQKMVLLYIGSQLDFRSNFLSQIKLTQKKIAKAIAKTPRSTLTILLDLEKNGYITATPSKNSSGNYYALESKIFDEYGELACEETSHANQPCEETNRGGVKKLHTPCEKTSYLFSLSSPFLFPIYLGARFGYISGPNAIAQIRRYDNINFKLCKETSMSLSEHPFMEVLKKGKAEKEAKKAHIVEVPKPHMDLGETSNDLFNKYKNYFSGGFGRFDYKAQRAMWDQSAIGDCVSELKETIEFYHGPDKHAACQIAAQKRMTDQEYAQHLLEEARGTKTRLAREKAERQEQIDRAKERKRLEADPKWHIEQEKKRKIRVEKLLAFKEKMKKF